jgi:ABC-2 type transport system ATP-binding protein
MTVLEADGLGRRFGRRRALEDCSFALPGGRFAALVGPNGAGKTTLLKIATGLLAPTSGRITVLGRAPDARGAPEGLSFLAQERPLYRGLRVAEMVRAGAVLNAGGRWDGACVDRLVAEAGLDPAARVAALSEGQRSRLALALALGRRPDLLLLDEPLAALDPLARRQVLGTLLGEVAETGTTVLMSTHLLADLDGVADHLVLLRGGAVGLTGDIDDLLAAHRRVTGLVDAPLPGEVVQVRRTGRQVTALVRGDAAHAAPGLEVAPPTLEDLVLAHLDPAPPAPSPIGATS